MSSQPIYIVTDSTTDADLNAQPLLVNGIARLVALSDGSSIPTNAYTITGKALIGILINSHDPSSDPLAINGQAALLFRTDDGSNPTGNTYAERGIAWLVDVLNPGAIGGGTGPSGPARLLEGGGYRLLENGSYRLLE